MPEEVSEHIAELSASELQVPTAEPVTEEVTEEVIAPEEQPAEAEKAFTQDDLDAAIGKRLAREQRKWDREQQALRAELQAKSETASARFDEFSQPDEYAEQLAVQKAQEMLTKQEEAKQHRQVIEAYHDKEEDARDKYADFEQVAYNPRVSITDVMAQTVQTSEVGPDIAYYLGSNPKEAQRISQLAPLMQAKEIGRIEDRLISSPPVKKTTSAPTPIAPVTARTTGSPSYDTTDPRSVKAMSTAEWIEAERQRQRRNIEAGRAR